MELTIGEGKVVIATDNLIKLSTDGVTWSPGSAGFDVQGNLAFMVCDPMKLAPSPTSKSCTSSSSSSSWKKDLPMQFGIPIPIICDWLNQHWDGSLDDLTKPKLPLIRLMSTGHKSEHSCTSFTLRQVFKSVEGQNDDDSSSSQIISRSMNQPATINSYQEENPLPDLCSSHEQGIPTPDIYESPRLTSGLVRKMENAQPQLLDINFPPRFPRSVVLPLAIKQLLPIPDENAAERPSSLPNPSREDPFQEETGSCNPDEGDEIVAVGSVTGDHSEVRSSSSPLAISETQNGEGFHVDYTSEGETMYSAETMESRNYTSPRQDIFQQVGRSQSCVNYGRWVAAQRNATSRRVALEKQRSLVQERKTHTQTAVSPKTRSNDYFSPTVSSIMKKRNSSEQLPRSRRDTVQLSPRWV